VCACVAVLLRVELVGWTHVRVGDHVRMSHKPTASISVSVRSQCDAVGDAPFETWSYHLLLYETEQAKQHTTTYANFSC
jgi:hypothetical protein